MLDSSMNYEPRRRGSGSHTGKQRAAGLPPPLGFSRSSRAAYWHFGSPSLFAGSNAVDQIERASCSEGVKILMFAVQPTAVVVSAGMVYPHACSKVITQLA